MTVPEWKAYGPVTRSVLALSIHPLYANAQCMHVHSCVIKQMITVCMPVLADHMDCVKADMSDSALHASRHSMPFLSIPCQCPVNA